MLAEPGGRPIDPRRRLGEARDRTDLLDRAPRHVGHGDGLTVVSDLLVLETFFAEPCELERDVRVGEEDLLPVLVRLCGHGFPEQVLPRLGVLGRGELRLLLESGVVEGVLHADRPAERLGLMGEHLGEDHPATVLRGHEEAVAARTHRAHRRGTVRGSRRALSVLPGHGAEVVERVEALQQGGLDVLAPPGRLACDERGEHAAERHVSGADAAQRRVDEDGAGPEAERAEAVQAGLGRHDALVRRDLRVGTDRAEASDRAGDEARIGPAETLASEAPVLGDAGTEPVDDDVRPVGQLPHARATLVGAQIRDDALLAAVPDQEAGRVFTPQAVSLGRLHLEHAGAVVGEQHAGHRRTDAAGAHLDHL